jgi:hypothetical protein
MKNQRIVEMSKAYCDCAAVRVLCQRFQNAYDTGTAPAGGFVSEAFSIWKDLRYLPSDGGPELNKAIAELHTLAHESLVLFYLKHGQTVEDEMGDEMGDDMM